MSQLTFVTTEAEENKERDVGRSYWSIHLYGKWRHSDDCLQHRRKFSSSYRGENDEDNTAEFLHILSLLYVRCRKKYSSVYFIIIITLIIQMYERYLTSLFCACLFVCFVCLLFFFLILFLLFTFFTVSRPDLVKERTSHVGDESAKKKIFLRRHHILLTN